MSLFLKLFLFISIAMVSLCRAGETTYEAKVISSKGLYYTIEIVKKVNKFHIEKTTLFSLRTEGVEIITTVLAEQMEAALNAGVVSVEELKAMSDKNHLPETLADLKELDPENKLVGRSFPTVTYLKLRKPGSSNKSEDIYLVTPPSKDFPAGRQEELGYILRGSEADSGIAVHGFEPKLFAKLCALSLDPLNMRTRKIEPSN